uniref:Uncharacterized protein n=1 Tax=Anguilla anguilla TaxID=7936 RepID=A0A0E9UMW5_ANGAN
MLRWYHMGHNMIANIFSVTKHKKTALV